MFYKKTAVLSAAVLLSGLSACTWVKLSDQGEQVDVRRSTSVADCKALGVLTVSGVDKVTGISRNKDKVEKELLTQARNDAAAMHANVIVPIEQPVEGRQQFSMYDCP